MKDENKGGRGGAAFCQKLRTYVRGAASSSSLFSVRKMRRRRAVKLGVEGAGSEENEAEEGSEAGGRGGPGVKKMRRRRAVKLGVGGPGVKKLRRRRAVKLGVGGGWE